MLKVSLIDKQLGLPGYCNTKTSRNGVNNIWKNSASLLSSLDQLFIYILCFGKFVLVGGVTWGSRAPFADRKKLMFRSLVARVSGRWNAL